jgi:hypothetical protein
MCFSASASFIAGTSLSVIGVAAIRRTRARTELPFAMIPLLFGIQQLIEGVIWLTFCQDAPLIHLATVTVTLSSSVSTWGLDPLVGAPCIRARPKAEHLLQDCEIFSSLKDKHVNPRPRCGDVAVGVA